MQQLLQESKTQQMKKCYISLVILAITLLSSCTDGIPIEMHKQLCGVWARKGFPEVLQKMYSPENIKEFYGDSICYYIIDPLYNESHGDTVFEYYCFDDPIYNNTDSMKPSHLSDSCPSDSETQKDSIAALTMEHETYMNKYSLTDEERSDKNKLWIIEVYVANGELYQHPFCLAYQGDGYFLSDILPDNKHRKYAKLKDDGGLQYGTCNVNGENAISVTLEKLFYSGWWYFNRYEYDGWIDVTFRLYDKIRNYFQQQAFVNLVNVELYEITDYGDELICTFKREDVFDENGLSLYGNGLSLYGHLNQEASVDTLEARLNMPEDAGFIERLNTSFKLTWKGDTAYLYHRHLDGLYYLKINKKK